MVRRDDAFELTSDESNYLQHQLDHVSRTFALVVPCVELPARHYLATAYLLCRVVDNIEDCTHPAAWKDAHFAEFLGLLDDPSPAADVLRRWDAELWPGLTEREAALMGHDSGLTLWRIYSQIPAYARDIVRRWTGRMAQGMRQLGDPERGPRLVRRAGVEILQEASDYESYCYYVAGTVGSMASELIVRQYGLTADVAKVLSLRAEACGRSLQKTNIIKDFAKDLGRGICYLPESWLSEAGHQPLSLLGAPPAWTAMVLGDVLAELREATEYVLALPYHAAGYRRASLLCLLPAYQTLLVAAERHTALFTAEHAVKISKVTMARCLADSQTMLVNNDAIRRYSRRLEGAISDQLKSSQRTGAPLLSQ